MPISCNQCNPFKIIITHTNLHHHYDHNDHREQGQVNILHRNFKMSNKIKQENCSLAREKKDLHARSRSWGIIKIRKESNFSNCLEMVQSVPHYWIRRSWCSKTDGYSNQKTNKQKWCNQCHIAACSRVKRQEG